MTDAEAAYEVGVALLIKRARLALRGRDDTLTLLANRGDDWLRPAPWAELSDQDREFWQIVVDLMRKAKMNENQIGSVLDAMCESSRERQDTRAKCGKIWEDA